MEMEQCPSWISDAFLMSVLTEDSFPDCDTFYSTATAATTPSNSESGSSSRTQNGTAVPTGKIKKRRTKKKKRSERLPTTFIATEPYNFRQMVERMTGASSGGGTTAVAPFGQETPVQSSWFQPGSSAFPPDPVQTFTDALGGSGFGSFGPAAAGAGRTRFDFGPLNCFPILESGGVT